MAKKRTTPDEKAHMTRVARLGCCICGRDAEIHHLPGQGVRSSNYDVIGLCPEHHRNGNIGVAVHSGRRSWEARHGVTERELWEKTNKILNLIY